MIRDCLVGCVLLLATAMPLVAQPEGDYRGGTEPLFGERDAIFAGIFAVGTVAIAPLDRWAAGHLQDSTRQASRFLLERSRNLDALSVPGTFIIGAALYGAGRLAGNERMADLGLHGTEAIIAAELLTGVVKGLAGRARPYVDTDDPFDFSFGRGILNEEFRSFPSGHSVAGFAAAAAVVTETSRWWPQSKWYVAPAMYGGAALIALSRMYGNRHWASDVLMGGAIGAFTGLKVVRYHHSHPGNGIDDVLLGVAVGPAAGGGTAVRLLVLPR